MMDGLVVQAYLPGARLVFVDGVLDAERSMLRRVTLQALEAGDHPLGRRAAGQGWSLRLDAEAVRRIARGGEVFQFRGEYLPLFSLHELLRIGGEAPAPEQGIVVILESEGRSFALQVDELVGRPGDDALFGEELDRVGDRLVHGYIDLKRRNLL